MKFIKENFLMLALIVLALIIVLQRCKEIVPVQQISQIKDTTIYIHDSSYVVKPIFVSKDTTIYRESTIYIPSDDYNGLVNQFEQLRDSLLSKNIYKDVAKFDSSTITITDTIQQNHIIGRKYDWNLKTPVVTINNYISPKLTNEFYVGGQIEDGGHTPPQINLNFLLKNKKNQIYGAGIGVNTNGNAVFNISSYWKIKL